MGKRLQADVAAGILSLLSILTIEATHCFSSAVDGSNRQSVVLQLLYLPVTFIKKNTDY